MLPLHYTPIFASVPTTPCTENRDHYSAEATGYILQVPTLLTASSLFFVDQLVASPRVFGSDTENRTLIVGLKDLSPNH